MIPPEDYPWHLATNNFVKTQSKSLSNVNNKNKKWKNYPHVKFSMNTKKLQECYEPSIIS